MYIVQFVSQPRSHDEEFEVLSAEIEGIAAKSGGLLGAEEWVATNGTRRNDTYYWSSLTALQDFSMHARHVQAKQQYRRWYAGYRIVVSEVIASYGPEDFEHVAPSNRARLVGRGFPRADLGAGRR